MGRFYLFRKPQYEDIRPYIEVEISAETREEAVGLTTACENEGDPTLLTAEELSSSVEGARALEAWRTGDDSDREAYDARLDVLFRVEELANRALERKDTETAKLVEAMASPFAEQLAT